MTRTEAEALVCQSAGPLCVRFERTADGAVKTLDYRAVPHARFGWKLWAGVGVILAAATGGVKQQFFPTPKPATTQTVAGLVALPMGRIAPACPTAPPPTNQVP